MTMKLCTHVYLTITIAMATLYVRNQWQLASGNEYLLQYCIRARAYQPSKAREACNSRSPCIDGEVILKIARSVSHVKFSLRICRDEFGQAKWKLEKNAEVYVAGCHSHEAKVSAAKAASLSALVKCSSSTVGTAAAAVGPTDCLDELDTTAKAVTEQ